MMNMMGEMMGRPRKEFYPSLMEMPPLTPEQRLNLESQARGRINSDIDGISAAEKNLRHAIAGGDIAAADQAARQIRDSLNQVQSGVTVLRALNEGSPPQQIAQNWFKSQMNLAPEPLHSNAEGLFGISWFHLITMELLAIFSAGMLTVYVGRMRRAERTRRSTDPRARAPPVIANYHSGASNERWRRTSRLRWSRHRATRVASLLGLGTGRLRPNPAPAWPRQSRAAYGRAGSEFARFTGKHRV